MIHHSVSKEILDAMFNINLYGEDDLAKSMIEKDIAYTPLTYEEETELAEINHLSSIDETRFNLTKKNKRYFEYNEYDRATRQWNEYETERCFTLTSKEPNTIEFASGRNCYVGLFTEMPICTKNESGEYGMTWKEPEIGDYRRINLHRGIISDDVSINTASIDSETGGTMVDNKELMVFPEAFQENREGGWGTIVGFGIFTDPTEGEPILWGRLNDPQLVDEAHVPLFIKGDFKIILA